jgi:hypothetical protein
MAVCRVLLTVLWPDPAVLSISQLTAQLQGMKEMMNTIMAQQMQHQDEARVCQTGGQESEIVEHQSPSRKNAFTRSVTPAGYRTDTGNHNG